METRQQQPRPASRVVGWMTLMLASLVFVPSVRTQAAEPIAWVGQVVCSQCWYEADRTVRAYGTPSDLSCAKNCNAAGIPSALAVRDPMDGSFSLNLLNEAPGGQAGWATWVGKFVEIRGTLDEARRIDALSVKLLSNSPWPELQTVSAAASPAHDHNEGHDPNGDHNDHRDDDHDKTLRWTDPDGQSVKLDSFRGSLVVLNFWATWCAPCVQEMPDLVEIQNRFAADGVQVVGAAAEPVEETDQVMAFAREHRLNFPVLLGADAEQMESLGLSRALPSTAILDREGKVVARIQGVVKPRALRRTLRELIADEGKPAERNSRDEAIAHAEDLPTQEDSGGAEMDAHGHPPHTDEASLVPS